MGKIVALILLAFGLIFLAGCDQLKSGNAGNKVSTISSKKQNNLEDIIINQLHAEEYKVPKTDISKWKSYRDKVNKFGFSYPENWMIHEFIQTDKESSKSICVTLDTIVDPRGIDCLFTFDLYNKEKEENFLKGIDSFAQLFKKTPTLLSKSDFKFININGRKALFEDSLNKRINFYTLDDNLISLSMYNDSENLAEENFNGLIQSLRLY
jgi:hypothetical protein